MIGFRRFLPLVAVLIGTVAFGGLNEAQASYQVRVYDDNVLQGGITTAFLDPFDLNSLSYGGTTTHFSVSGSGLSNNPGDPSGGGSNLDLSSNSKFVANFGAAGGTHTLRIEISQDGWTAPTGSPLILSSAGGGSFTYVGTSGGTQSVVVGYQGFLDTSNTLFGQPLAGSTPAQSATVSRTSAGNNGYRLLTDPSTSLVAGGTPFSITDVLSFKFTLDPLSGSSFANGSASTIASVPAPAGAVLAMTALPLLGIGRWLRRRQQGRPVAV